ncbi:OmpA family protein [Aureisphaera sp. CAU 1614]|uniref:OmpA family protein n=1 Tax=Halomarinibacterium sedimenti TaxID=2857106 RepID=A0A9X1FS53_9FLAO|nr:OmpA family protein [Halomarinibacterium sedimenti]MBW2938862.1 OmpA family protein [Halomarinibacterium sedimenti]
MKIKYTSIYITLFVTLFSISSFSQEGKVKKGDKDFDRFEYIDAREIYLKVVENGYQSAQLYENLGDTYYWNSDYANAAKWYSKLISEFSNETQPIYYYRAAQSFKSLNDFEKSEKFMNTYVEKSGDSGMLNAINTETTSYDVTLKKVTINSAYSDFGPSFYKDKVVFASSKPGGESEKIHKWMGQPFTDLYIANVDEKSNLTNASPLGGEVNTKYHETSPAFTKDGKTMYFTRNNFIDGKKGTGEKKTIRLKIYKATLSGENNWTNIKELPFNNDDYSTAHPALSPDEKRLYFSSEMPGSIGMSDLWFVDILGEDSYSQPKNLGASVNTEARETFPFISESNVLYFASDGRGGLGGYDLFKANLTEDGADEVVNLGEPANSNKDDFGFIINEEKKIGYLSSNRDGEEGSINDDIYTVFEECTISISGKVYDVDNGQPISGALVTLFDENNSVIETYKVNDDGLFSFVADCEKQYNLRAEKDKYETYEQMVITPKKSGTLFIPMPLKLIDPCPDDDLGCRLVLQPIYFDFDKSNIRPDAEIELAKILAAMIEYPELKIHIESHTDSRGSKQYNISLSKRRAKSTLDWLVSKGVSRNRLTAEGYGESQLQNNCKDGVECTEEEHQLNRRSMFIIKN